MKKTVKSEVSQCAASGSSVPHHWMCTDSTTEDIDMNVHRQCSETAVLQDELLWKPNMNIW